MKDLYRIIQALAVQYENKTGQRPNRLRKHPSIKITLFNWTALYESKYQAEILLGLLVCDDPECPLGALFVDYDDTTKLEAMLNA